jgi:hypothetical protein
MKTIIILVLCLISSISLAQSVAQKILFFKVTSNSSTIKYEGDKEYFNHSYKGLYLNENETDNLREYIDYDGYQKNYICLVFNNLIYVIKFNDFKEDDEGWNVIEKASIAIINWPGTKYERNFFQTLTSGKIRFNQKKSSIFFKETLFEEDISRKI